LGQGGEYRKWLNKEGKFAGNYISANNEAKTPLQVVGSVISGATR